MRAGCEIAIVVATITTTIVGMPVICAQPSSTTAAATAAFDRGRALVKEGKFVDACAAFEQSEKLEPAYGTLYNLAGCDVHIGKLASAWAAYRELAQRDTNRARRDDAATQASALEARLPRLAITATPKPTGLAVVVDGVDVTGVLGTDTPVDLGSHHIEAHAPGYKAWQSDATVSSEGATLPVAIELEPAPDEPVKPIPVTAPVNPVEARPASSRRTYAAIAAASGGALIATGVVFGKLASTKWDDAKRVCGDALACSNDDDLRTGSQLLADARVRADVATGLIAGGIAVLGTSLVLWLTAPGASTTRVGVGMSATPWGLSIAGGF